MEGVCSNRKLYQTKPSTRSYVSRTTNAVTLAAMCINHEILKGRRIFPRKKFQLRSTPTKIAILRPTARSALHCRAHYLVRRNRHAIDDTKVATFS